MLLTEAQAAREAQVDRRTIRRLIVEGRLRAADFGSGKRRHFRIDPADLRAIAPLPTSPAAPMPPRSSRRRRGQSSSPAPLAAYLPSV